MSRGVVLPTRFAVFGVCVLALGALVLVLTALPHHHQPAATPVASAPTPTAASTTSPAPKRKHAPSVKRGTVSVVVFNNSGIHGLAGRTAARAQTDGWKVVGSDNWYGTVDSSTVYYPPSLHAAAKLLAHDLDIARVKPAISPMRMTQLTVILTADYQ